MVFRLDSKGPAPLRRCDLIVSSPVHCFAPGSHFVEAIFVAFRVSSKSEKERKSDRSHQELSNEYLLANIGVDTAENESSK